MVLESVDGYGLFSVIGFSLNTIAKDLDPAAFGFRTTSMTNLCFRATEE